jgi:tetratricopeptide (TPR) repeat protein
MLVCLSQGVWTSSTPLHEGDITSRHSVRSEPAARSLKAEASSDQAPAAAGPREDLADAVVRLAAALTGAFGDEGPQVGAAIDAAERALARWDDEMRALEARVARAGAAVSARELADARAELGLAYLQRGRVTDAVRELERSIALDGRRADVRIRLGLVHESTASRDAAVAAFRAAWAASPADPVAAYHLLRSTRDTADSPDRRAALEVMTAVWRSALTRAPDATARPFPDTSMIDARAAGATIALPAPYARAAALFNRGDFAAAIAEARDALRADPLMADPGRRSARMAQGSAALKAGRVALAIQHFGAVAQEAPASSEAHRLLGVAHWTAYDLEPSLAALDAAIRIAPADERTRVMRVRVLVQMGALDAAVSTLKETIDAVPGSTLARLWLGSVLTSLNRQIEASQALTSPAILLLAGSAPLLVTAATQQDAAADLDAARATLEQAVRASPNSADARVALARVYQNQDRRDEAFVEYAAALLIDPVHPIGHLGIGRIHFDAERYGDAVVALRRLLDLQPGYNLARYALANALLRSGREEEGKRELAEFGRLQAIQSEQKRRAMALDIVKEEAALRAAERKFDRAIELWEQALAQEPTAATHAALAAALAGAGRLDAAVQQYERAASLGAPPDVHRELATLYAALGRQQESAAARARYEQALLVPTAEGSAR